MAIYFQIFLTQAEMDEKTDNINVLLGYPNAQTKTETYRDGDQKYEGTSWAAAVNNDLIEACAAMTSQQRADYYDDSDLKTPQWLENNNWWHNGD